MATTTTKYCLIKPQLTDAADVTATNSNWDKIDTELNTLKATKTQLSQRIESVNSSSLDQGNTLNNKIDTEIAKLQPKITFGFDRPSNGYHGDVYIQLIEE